MTAPVLHIDLETKSTVDLRKAGRFVYADHPSTDVWCAAFAFGDDPVSSWTPKTRSTHAAEEITIKHHVNSGGLIYAHNAGFEFGIWHSILSKRYGWPMPGIRQMRCTAAMARSMNLPGDLDGAAMAVGLQHRKDQAGYRHMLKMCRPRKIEDNGAVIWWDSPEDIAKLVNYCKQDVVVERALDHALRPLSEDEQELWFLDQEINNRGIYLDKAAITDAAVIVEQELDRIDKEVNRLTRANVTGAAKVKKMTEWLQSLGVELYSLGKEGVKDYLKQFGEDMDPTARRILELRLTAAKSSTAKLSSMLNRRGSDGRARENFIFSGAGTRRWAGVGIQVQNLPRDTPKDIDDLIDTFKSRDGRVVRMLHGEPMDMVKSSLRGMICAPAGYKLLAGDFANIEGRVIAWLAGENWKLDAFRAYDAGTGPDLYKLGAAAILHKPIEDVTPEERQSTGKVPELALNYGGGVGAFQALAVTYGVKVSDEAADTIKVNWRAANPNIVQYWWDLDRSAHNAVRSAGIIYWTGNCAFRVSGNVLWLKLPSGGVLAYPDPKIMPVETPWGEMRDSVTYMGTDAETKHWGRIKMYGGKWAENITQAASRDLLAEAMKRLSKRGYPIVMHSHDEIVAEVSETPTDEILSLTDMLQGMEELPAWAVGLPIKAAGWQGKRYRK